MCVLTSSVVWAQVCNKLCTLQEERLKARLREEEEQNRAILEKHERQIQKATSLKESKEVEQIVVRVVLISPPPFKEAGMFLPHAPQRRSGLSESPFHCHCHHPCYCCCHYYGQYLMPLSTPKGS